MLGNAQKKVFSNIFRDLSKLTVAALVLGQFVPGQKLNIIIVFCGLGSAIIIGIIAAAFAVDEISKGGDNQ